LSVGGEHSYLNTQCACRQCNQEKGNRGGGQLRLFG
jgi:5-methylcytosine-specific restriction endonuclease McrA